MRYVIFGAGAIGSAIGARLHIAGREVVLIARGRHLTEVRADGLRLETPDGEKRLAVSAVGSPRDVEIDAADVVLMAMKSHDTIPALEALAGHADRDVAIVCAQNGVENERAALRWFPNVYGMFVWLAAEYTEPGTVRIFAVPPAAGVLDLGCIPAGVDRRAEAIARDLGEAGFASRTDPRIMRWKYAKLLSNLGNALEALLGPTGSGEELELRARAEALACYAAASIDHLADDEFQRRVSSSGRLRQVGGQDRRGGSTWQSLARGRVGIETPYLNGEIVLLGRLHGVPTPVNRALTAMALQAARHRTRPGSVTAAEIESEVAHP